MTLEHSRDLASEIGALWDLVDRLIYFSALTSMVDIIENYVRRYLRVIEPHKVLY